MDTDKIRKLATAVFAVSRRAAKGTPRISIPAQLTDDDQVLWQAAENLDAAANELDTLRAENARLAALVSEAASYAWSVIDSYNDYPAYARPEWLEDWRKLLGKLGEKVDESEET